MNGIAVFSGLVVCGNPDCPTPEGHQIVAVAHGPMEAAMLAKVMEISDELNGEILRLQAAGELDTPSILVRNDKGTIITVQQALPAMQLIAARMGGI